MPANDLDRLTGSGGPKVSDKLVAGPLPLNCSWTKARAGRRLTFEANATPTGISPASKAFEEMKRCFAHGSVLPREQMEAPRRIQDHGVHGPKETPPRPKLVNSAESTAFILK